MTPSPLSTEAASARESHRSPDGKFGSQPAPEADGIDLGAGAPRDWSSDPELTDQDLLVCCRKYARQMARRYQIQDVDDLASDTVAGWLNEMKNRRDKVSAGTVEPTMTVNTEAKIRSIAAGLAMREASGMPHGGRDLTALTKYLRTREAFELKYGRAMTSAEENVLADEIRGACPPGRRPVDRFHRTRREGTHTSLEGMREVNSSWEPTLSLDAQVPQAPEPTASDSLAEQALDDVEEGGRSGRNAARRKLWSVMSATTGAPGVRADALSSSRAGSVREDMETLGGVSAALDAYSRDDISGQQLDTLLAPWGRAEDISVRAQNTIVSTIETDPAYADQVWDAALFSATRSRPSKVAASR